MRHTKWSEVLLQRFHINISVSGCWKHRRRSLTKNTDRRDNIYNFHGQRRHVPLIFVLLIDVKDVIPHFPTVPADLAAEGRLLFSLKSLSN